MSYDLVFEVLRLVLIISLTIVQIGTAFIKIVSKQFDKGMLRVLDLSYKGGWLDFTDPVKESASRTGSSKLTDV